MKRFIRRFSLPASMLAFCFGTAAASDKAIEKPVAADTPEKFEQVAAGVRQEMSQGGRYEFIRPDDKAKVMADLDSMAAMLQKAGSVSAMPQADQVKLFNTQEHLNGILTHSDRNRLVCEHRAPMGSNIPQTSCKTVAEIEKMRRDSQKYMTDHAQDANINSAAMHAEKGGGH